MIKEKRKAPFSNVFGPHENVKPALLNSFRLKSFFEKHSFHADGRPNYRNKAAFSNFSGVIWMLPKNGQLFAFCGDFVSPHSLSSLQVFKWFRTRTGSFPHLVGLMVVSFLIRLAFLKRTFANRFKLFSLKTQ